MGFITALYVLFSHLRCCWQYIKQLYTARCTHYQSRYMEPNDEFQFTVNTQEQEHTEKKYFLHYIIRRYQEILELQNVGFSNKIKKDGTKHLSTKRYEFKDRTLRMDIVKNEHTWYYKSHRHMTKINKNKTSEHFVRFKNVDLDIRENYNSKGVCTRSLLNIDDGRSIQLHLKKGIVTAYCQCEFGKLKNCTIKLPNLHDASVVNLYNIINCFELDLMFPDNELFVSYTSSLQLLKKCVQNCLENDSIINPVLRTMLGNIEENEKSN